MDPPSTPSRSPASGARSRERGAEEPNVEPTVPQAVIPPASGPDFFADDLRGYRLLKACRLSHSERQNILLQTSNSAHFTAIRRSVRTLFADDPERAPSRPGKIWWNDDDWWQYSPDMYYDDHSWHDGSPGSYGSDDAWHDHESYWNEWYEDWNEPTAYWDSYGDDQYDEEPLLDESSSDPEPNFVKRMPLQVKPTKHCSKLVMQFVEWGRQGATSLMNPWPEQGNHLLAPHRPHLGKENHPQKEGLERGLDHVLFATVLIMDIRIARIVFQKGFPKECQRAVEKESLIRKERVLGNPQKERENHTIMN